MTTILFSTLLLISSINIILTSHPLLEFLAVSTAINTKGAIYYDNLIKDTNIFRKYYDFIIVGGGTAGCVLANRLSKNPKTKVLLIEAGRDENYIMTIPLVFPYLQLTEVNWKYRPEPQEGACLGMVNNRCKFPRGKVLGGCSTINAMVFTRGNKKDFDLWENNGNYGWGFDEMLKYYKKFEKIMIPELQSSYRGNNGPVPVSYSPFKTDLGKSFLKAGQNFGYNIIDYNGEYQTGFNYLQTSTLNGSRYSSNRAYIMPIRNRKNLHVTKKTRVIKILINPITKIAYGVEFIKNQRKFTVYANKEVIISAGVFGTPQLLMLSGIGPAEHLNSFNIPVIKDLKVGYNFQDHIELGAALVFVIDANISTLATRIYNDYNYNTFEYVKHNRGPFSSPATLEALGFINTPINNETNDFPDIELQFLSGGVASDAALPYLAGIKSEIYTKTFKSLEGKDTFTLFPLLLRPESRGRVMLKNKNPFRHPLIYANYLEKERDLEVMLEGVKFGIKLALSDEFKKYGTRLHDIPLPGCKHIQFNTDNYWRCAIRHLTFTNYHQCCTSKMGPQSDPDSVVDPELRVHGVKKLRVVDVSIMPIIPSAHIMTTVYAIAEKASDMILNDNRDI